MRRLIVGTGLATDDEKDALRKVALMLGADVVDSLEDVAKAEAAADALEAAAAAGKKPGDDGGAATAASDSKAASAGAGAAGAIAPGRLTHVVTSVVITPPKGKAAAEKVAGAMAVAGSPASASASASASTSPAGLGPGSGSAAAAAGTAPSLAAAHAGTVSLPVSTCKRTLKYLHGVVRGAWVLSSEWLRACDKHG